MMTFTDEELGQIRAEFDARSHGDSSMIRCCEIVQIMAVIGICPEEEDVYSLLTQLEATHETEISFAELIDIMALLNRS